MGLYRRIRNSDLVFIHHLLAITSPTKIMSSQSSKTSKAASLYSIGMFSPGEARYVCGQACDQDRIDAANAAAQNWVSDYQGIKSLMFLEAFNSLLKWKEN